MNVTLQIAKLSAVIAGSLLVSAVPMGVLEVDAYGFTALGTKTLVVSACLVGYLALGLMLLSSGQALIVQVWREFKA
jgi:hypothetical protein